LSITDIVFRGEVLSACEIAKELVESETNEQGDAEDSTEVQLSEKLTEVKEVMQTDRVLRSREGLKKPMRFENSVMLATDKETVSYPKAMQLSNSREWKNAMDGEMCALIQNSTWTLVDRPSDSHIVDNKWVLKTKMKSNGDAERHKARLVAKGYSQQQSIEYNEKFSPVARFDTIRMLMSVAAHEKLKLSQFNVKTAFLYETLQDDFYMNQPEGFDDGSGRVCKLRKSLYGLEQAPRCWNIKLYFYSQEEWTQTE
jgi:hypothetical protein